MEFYFYIITSGKDSFLHIGYTKDIKRAILFYKSLPNELKDYNRLVYLEQYKVEENARNRHEEVTRFTKAQKEELVNSINPGWVELVPGINIIID